MSKKKGQKRREKKTAWWLAKQKIKRAIYYWSNYYYGILYLKTSAWKIDLGGHPHIISDFWGPFLTHLPTHIRFFNQFRAFLLVLHRLYPIFLNLPTYPKIGYHMWMAPSLFYDGTTSTSDLIFTIFLPWWQLYFENLAFSCIFSFKSSLQVSSPLCTIA